MGVERERRGFGKKRKSVLLKTVLLKTVLLRLVMLPGARADLARCAVCVLGPAGRPKGMRSLRLILWRRPDCDARRAGCRCTA